MSAASRMLVPVPRHLEEGPGILDLSRGFAVICPGEAMAQARVLADWLAAIPGAGSASGPCLPGSSESLAARAAVELVLAPPYSRAAAGPASLDSQDPRGASPQSLAREWIAAEAYSLQVSEGLAVIQAADPRGLARGAATLWQLALAEGPRLAGCRVEDAPRFAWRGFMLDTARNFYPVEEIERFLDLAALHRLSVFHWHLTDDQAWRLELPSLPELTAKGARRRDRRFNWEVWNEGSYSPDDVRRVVSFAAARGILVVPEIETPGHVTALLASHPELSCRSATDPGARFEPADSYGVFEDILCAGNEESLALLERVFADLAALFPGPWVHVGGDEAPKARWKACPRCRARLSKIAGRPVAAEPSRAELEGLQAWFMGRVAGILHRYGKRMIGWDEILDSGAAPGGGGIPEDAAVMSWRGYEGGAAGARRGHGVIMCPQTKACYLDHKHLDSLREPGQLGVCTVRDSWSFEPIPSGLSAIEEARVLGGQGNLWSELVYFGRQAEYMAFPRLSALADSLWSGKENTSYENFTERLAVHLGRLETLGVNSYRGPLE